MEDKKYCIKCGEELPLDGVYCQKCGAKISKSNNTSANLSKLKSNKIPIIIFLVILVVGGLFIFPSLWYQTEKADELIFNADNELTLADSKIEEHDKKIDVLKEKYSYLYEDFFDESEDIASKSLPESKLMGLNRYYSESEEIDLLKQDILNHYTNAREYLLEAKNLRLPNWYYEFLDLQIKSCDKSIEALNIHNEAEINDGNYLRAKINLEASRIYTALGALGTYTFGAGLEESYQSNNYDTLIEVLDSSLESYSKSSGFLEEAYNSVQINSISQEKSKVDCMIDFSNTAKIAVDADSRGDYFVATSYYEKASNRFKSCKEFNIQKVISDLESWKIENVDKNYNKETNLWKEGNDYYTQSITLWNNNYNK